MSDHVIRCLLKDRPIRVVAAITTDVAREASRRHGLVAGAQVAVARAATSGLLLATMTKGKERIMLQVLGDGPLGGAIVDAYGNGQVRAYLKAPGTLIPGGAGKRVRLVGGVGRKGVVNVIRDLGLKERVSGQAPILSGEIDADVEHYLTTSEQIESALGCDAVLGEDGTVRAAGGVLVQCLPDDPANKEMVAEMWKRLRLDAVYDTLASDNVAASSAEDLARAVLDEHADEIDVLDIGPASFHCPCTRERVVGALELMSDDDIQTMIDDDGGAEITCDFCREVYQFSADDLTGIKDARQEHAEG